MSSPAKPASARRARTALLLAALLALALALGGCGGDEPTQAAQDRPDEPIDISGTDPVGQIMAGSGAQLATCADWQGASEPERLATIADIRAQLAPQDSGITAPQLTDDEGEELFDGACEPTYAGGFRLYKLYARAVGFVELKREIEESTGG